MSQDYIDRIDRIENEKYEYNYRSSTMALNSSARPLIILTVRIVLPTITILIIIIMMITRIIMLTMIKLILTSNSNDDSKKKKKKKRGCCSSCGMLDLVGTYKNYTS